jgi:TPR repeat protein
MTMRKGLIALGTALAFALELAAQAALPATGEESSGYDEAASAFLRGDYRSALNGLRPLAAAGYAWAQYDLGQLYDNGLGVTQNRAEAARWYHRAADGGDEPAQHRLGMMFASSLGVRQELVQAYFWLDQAAGQAAGREQTAVENERYSVVLHMSPAQLLAAERLTNRWRAAHRALTPAQLAQRLGGGRPLPNAPRG